MRYRKHFARRPAPSPQPPPPQGEGEPDTLRKPSPHRGGWPKAGRGLRWLAPLLLMVALAMIALSACGTQGSPPALGKPVQVTLSASGAATTLGQATLTPAYGAHVVVYMHGALVPYVSPQTPAQLREGSCYGKVVAPLTSNAPTGGSALEVQGGSDKGANVALPVDANWYVVVLESAAPNAAITACGHPLNNMRQYFDLYEPDKVDQG